MIDSAMFYSIGTVYPLVARATYPALGFPQYAGKVRTSAADDAMKAEAQDVAAAALAAPLEAYRAFFLEGKQFIGATSPRSPTPAWRRRSSSYARSTTSSPRGPRSTWRPWSGRSATPIRSRRRTCGRSWPRPRRRTPADPRAAIAILRTRADLVDTARG